MKTALIFLFSLGVVFSLKAQPVITQQPTNQTVLVGSSVVFSVAVSGSGPFTYQWQFNGTNLPTGIITTLAGNGTNGYSGENGTATNAELNQPAGVAINNNGYLFIADNGNNRIRKVATNGIITTVAGGGNNGLGDGGVATNAKLRGPFGVAIDNNGNLFIADQGNNRIRKVWNNGSPYSSLTLSNVATQSIGNYQVIVIGNGGSVTSSVAKLTVFIPPQSFTGVVTNSNQLCLQFNGTTNYPYILQAATNLTPPVNWQPVLTNPADSNGNWLFTDTNLNGSQKFYRATTP